MAATQHLRIFEPHPGLFAYYDGRVPGYRWMAGDNWVDDGAIALGIASYALVAGTRALVYDSHVSLDHGHAIRTHLQGLGVTGFTVIYSHWHLDHVAGTAAFPGAEVIANARTLAHLARHRAGIEDASFHGLPAIRPLVLPTRSFSGRMALDFGGQPVELIQADIHSDDATLLWLPERGILLAGDTVEDTVTYVDAPEDFPRHLDDLARIAALGARHILPNHGDPARIASGGYDGGLIAATACYIRWLQDHAAGAAESRSLRDILPAIDPGGALTWWPDYEAIHRQNLARTRAARPD